MFPAIEVEISSMAKGTRSGGVAVILSRGLAIVRARRGGSRYAYPLPHDSPLPDGLVTCYLVMR